MLAIVLVLLGECSGAEKGNPVRIRGCPAAVSENQTHGMHWPFGWEAVGGRKTAKAEALASPKTCRPGVPNRFCEHHDASRPAELADTFKQASESGNMDTLQLLPRPSSRSNAPHRR
jgi:hypothetical protein